MPETLVASLEGPPGAPVVVLGNSLGTTRELWKPQAGVLGGRFKGPFALKNARGDTIATFDSENQAVRYAKARAKEIYQRAKAGETEAAGARKLPSHLEIVSAAAKAATRGIPDAAEGGRIVRNIRRYANLARVARGKGARDKCRHPVADHAPDLGRRQRPAAVFAQHFVKRGAQVEHGVDERAIEIKNEKKAFHKRNFVLSLHILQQALCCNFSGAA